MIKTQKIESAVILAAGKGSRISELPLTRILPKSLLPIVNKPIVEHIIHRLKEIGIKKILFVLSFKKEVFKEYFGDGRDFGVEIEYVECPDPNNIGRLGDGLYLVKEKVDGPFVVVLGDDFTIIPSFEVFVKKFFERNALAVEAVVKEKDVDSLKRACTVLIDETGQIKDIVEKPEVPKWQMRGCGIYVFDRKIFEYIEKTPLKNGGRDLTNAIRAIAKKTGRAYGVEVDINININTLKDLNNATLLLMGKPQSA